MFTRSTLLAACSVLIASYSVVSAESTNLGKIAAPEAVASWDVSIGPDGAGLPSGSGTPRQGEQVYLAKCLGCHGDKGAGKPNDRLAGGKELIEPGRAAVKTVGNFWPYATTVFDYVRRAMPLNEPKSLGDEEVYAVVAYILWLNGVIGENDKMDAKTLPAVQMPNRDGFIRFSPGQ